MLDYAARLTHHVKGRRAVHVRLSLLSPANRREHHLRIVMNTFEPLLRKFEGQIFRMWNDDIIVAVKDALVAEIDDYVVKLRFLFSEDPLLSQETQPGREFCAWYDMAKDHPKFLKAAQDFAAGAAQHRKRMIAAHATASSGKNAGATVLKPLTTLTPVLLDRFETSLRGLDLSTIIERQMICALQPDGKPKPIMCEHFVSIQALQNRLLPGVDCLSDRWLFQHLSQSLDLRILAALPEMTKPNSLPITLNINISTILSAEFLKFDTAIRRIGQQAMVLELQSIDLFADMGSYVFARDFAHERGYGLALDSLNHLTFPLMDRAKLKLDFEKIQWSPEIVRDIGGDRREAFVQAIQQAGTSRVILCRCDDQSAIDFGRDVGISLFQGRHLDRMLAAG